MQLIVNKYLPLVSFKLRMLSAAAEEYLLGSCINLQALAP